MSSRDQNRVSERASALAKNPPTLLKGRELKEAAYRLAEEFRLKIKERQRGVPTMLDNSLLSLIEQLRQVPESVAWEEDAKLLQGPRGEQLREAVHRLQGFLSRRSQGRFVEFHDRVSTTSEGIQNESEIGNYEMLVSQGLQECMQWKGMPLFKTVYDFCLYSMMLWNLEPRTIIELGSGTGASALWLAQLMKAYELQSHVYSVDLNKIALRHDDISFIQGDCWEIEKVFGEELLSSVPHPWLFIEDAHVNVYGVLSHFHPFFEKGDYVVIEDSIMKVDVIDRLLKRYPNCYKVDTYYTDFFGRNSTCSFDSILIRV